MPLTGPAPAAHRFSTVLAAALIAGLTAGLLVAAVQFVWTEPVVDQAILLEEERATQSQTGGSPSAQTPEEPMVDRSMQKKGLFLGYAIYGVAWGLLYGASYFIAQSKLTLRRPFVRALIVAACSYWAVGLLPFLKYPANPPGVGDPDSLAYRQQLYLAILAMGILLMGAAFGLREWSSRRGWSKLQMVLPAALLVFGSLALYVGLPNNPDAISAPPALVESFRLHSLAGLTAFWLVLGVVQGVLLERARKSEPEAASCVRLGHVALDRG